MRGHRHFDASARWAGESINSDATGTKKSYRRILPADIQSGSPVAANPATCPDRQGAIALRADVIAHER